MAASCPLTLIGAGQGSYMLVAEATGEEAEQEPWVCRKPIAGASLVQSLAASPTSALACLGPTFLLDPTFRPTPGRVHSPRQAVSACPASSGGRLHHAAVACPYRHLDSAGTQEEKQDKERTGGEGACQATWSTPKQGADASNDLTPLLHVGSG